ncbi:putative E3 ubiquitin ligase SUD1 [Cardamine amara subsp. amara]|uniref:E3 ubiquitin ligase SUD1 n=1 Tax=Cardamine amara subsp. amara TaxID=228776 RepID=A0ABD1AVG1_CARAN
MGDHFVLLVDRLITESTIEAAIQSRNQNNIPVEVEECTILDEKTLEKLRNGDLSMVLCRICHDEDLDSNMETPCSCSGSLKYAHRRCVQRWCNEKGDTTCEICHQEFKPDYTAPAPLLELGHVPLHFRGNWGISRREHRFITVVPADSTFLDQQYPLSSTTSFICCRSLVLIFMALLILRHTLPLLLTGSNLHVFPLFTLLFLRVVGIMLPIYVVTKAAATCRRHSQPLDTSHSEDSSDEETDSWRLPQTQSYIIGV